MSTAEAGGAELESTTAPHRTEGPSGGTVAAAGKEAGPEGTEQGMAMKEKKKKKGRAKGEVVAGTTEAAADKREYTYEQELEWCIEQLNLGLKRSGVTPEQAAESNRVIKILTSAKTPLPKKRATMHLTFGDYRKWMKKTGVVPLGDPVE